MYVRALFAEDSQDCIVLEHTKLTAAPTHPPTPHAARGVVFRLAQAAVDNAQRPQLTTSMSIRHDL
jgi:hypothetical protein